MVRFPSGVHDTRPVLSPAPSAEARKGRETSVVLRRAGGEGDMVTIPWMPNPISRYCVGLGEWP